MGRGAAKGVVVKTFLNSMRSSSTVGDGGFGSPPRIPSGAQTNIESIMAIEHEFVRLRSWSDRFGEVITRYAGNIGFAVAHLFGFVGWVLINSGVIPGLDPFDPYPYSLLGLIVALEAVFLSTFVLMTQRWQTRQADHWAHLNLQVGLLAEQETTKMLQMLATVCDHLGMKTSHDGELKEMIEKTPVADLAEELAHNLETAREAVQASPVSAHFGGDDSAEGGDVHTARPQRAQ